MEFNPGCWRVRLWCAEVSGGRRRELQSQGLTSTFNGGRTPGKNLHVAMADRALKQVAMLMGELRLTPKTRPPKKPTGEWAEFLKGP